MMNVSSFVTFLFLTAAANLFYGCSASSPSDIDGNRTFAEMSAPAEAPFTPNAYPEGEEVVSDNALPVDNIFNILVFNGDTAPKGRFKYYVYLPGGCGGSLIAPRVVLTAAHCVYDGDKKKPKPIEFVSVNAYTRPFKKSIKRRAQKIIWHPNFTKQNGWQYDIALILLGKKVTKIDPVKLGKVGNSKMLTVIGMGAKAGRDAARRTNVLLQGKVKIKTKGVDCRGLGKWYKNDVCTGALPTGKKQRQCPGDSGGPLVINRNSAKKDIQVSLVSRGGRDEKGYCTVKKDALSKSVWSFKGWIERIINNWGVQLPTWA